MSRPNRTGSKSGDKSSASARSSATAGPSTRLLRVGEMLRHALSDVLARGELRDPALQGISITVSEVRPSPDLRQATVFIMPLGGEDVAPVIEGLGRSAGHLAHLVSEKVALRFFPRFIFRVDPSFEAAGRIESLLRDPRVARDLDHHESDEEGDDDQHEDEGHEGEGR